MRTTFFSSPLWTTILASAQEPGLGVLNIDQRTRPNPKDIQKESSLCRSGRPIRKITVVIFGHFGHCSYSHFTSLIHKTNHAFMHHDATDVTDGSNTKQQHPRALGRVLLILTVIRLTAPQLGVPLNSWQTAPSPSSRTTTMTIWMYSLLTWIVHTHSMNKSKSWIL